MRTASRCRPEYHRTDRRDIDIAVVHLPHIANFTDFNAWRHSQTSGCAMSDPQALADADLVILRAVKIPSAICAGCAKRHGARGRAGPAAQVPLLGICGGYQMLGENIIDGWSLALAPSPGWGAEDRDHFAQHKTTTSAGDPGSALPVG